MCLGPRAIDSSRYARASAGPAAEAQPVMWPSHLKRATPIRDKHWRLDDGAAPCPPTTVLMRTLLLLSLVAGLTSTQCASDHDAMSPPDLSVYQGTYRLPNGDSLMVRAEEDGLVIRMPGEDLFQFSDHRADSRVLAIEAKSQALIEALADRNRLRIADLMGGSNGPIEDAVSNLLEVTSPAFQTLKSASPYEVIGTVYRDEDSNHGFEDDGWGWQIFLRFDGDPDDVVVRLVWDGPSGILMHWGTVGEPPTADSLRFESRAPSRSWIRAFDPTTKTIRRLREMERETRASMIPARFSAYDVNSHQTVGVRFRKESPEAPMRVEIGPLPTTPARTGYRVRR